MRSEAVARATKRPADRQTCGLTGRQNETENIHRGRGNEAKQLRARQRDEKMKTNEMETGTVRHNKGQAETV